VTDWSKVIVTGGSGLLGGELKQLLPGAKFPSSSEFNVTNFSQMRDYAKAAGCQMLVHAAAFTSPPLVEKDPQKALDVNIAGTANVVKICIELGARLVYISTDYVFKGDKGNYKETDPVLPANKYAWSKLGGECAVRMFDKSLIIRTTFGPNVFPYPKAFIDQWTSRESVSAIAKKIVKLLDKDITGTVHVGGKRKTVYEYAKSLDETKEIGKISLKDVTFVAPADTSLNCEKFHELTE
jgi:dTDP-4-dehydrorhamnose reductase